MQAMTVFNYCDILRLRSDIASETETPFLKRLRQFRQIHQAAEGNPDLALKNFLDLWSYLSSEHGGYLSLPPLYQDNSMLIDILENFTVQLCLRENGETLQTGNMILGGVEGTGKTTLAKAMTLAVAICCENYFLIYFDYKTTPHVPTAQHLCKELIQRLALRDYKGVFGSIKLREDIDEENFCNCLEILSENFGDVGIIADEIPVVLSPANTELAVRKEVMRSLEDLTRNFHRTFLVLTGSSSDLRSRLFSGRVSDSVNPWDFNRSLCDFYHVPLLREIKPLKRYLHIRYTELSFSEDEVRMLLYFTGGIGRRIHQSVTNRMKPLGLSKIEGSFKNEYAGPSCALRVIVAVIRRDNPEIIAMLEKYWVGESPLTLSTCMGTSLTAVHDARAYFRVEKPTAVVDHYINQGFLYMKTGDSEKEPEVQLSLPFLAKCTMRGTDANANDVIQLMAIVMMMYNKSGVNARITMEDFLLPRLHKLGNPFKKWCGKVIKISSVGKLVNGDDDNIFTSPSSDLVGLFKWKKEMGLDGVQFHVKGATMITIDGWQNKGGA